MTDVVTPGRPKSDVLHAALYPSMLSFQIAWIRGDESFCKAKLDV